MLSLVQTGKKRGGNFHFSLSNWWRFVWCFWMGFSPKGVMSEYLKVISWLGQIQQELNGILCILHPDIYLSTFRSGYLLIVFFMMHMWWDCLRRFSAEAGWCNCCCEVSGSLDCVCTMTFGRAEWSMLISKISCPLTADQMVLLPLLMS